MTNEELYQSVVENRITLNDAWEMLKAKPKPWHTKEWKRKRELMLGDSCEYCYTTENLVLQHSPYKLKYEFIFEQAKEYFINNYYKNPDSFTKEEIDSVKKTFKTTTVYKCRECNRTMQKTDKNTNFKCIKCNIKYKIEEIKGIDAILTEHGYLPVDHKIFDEKAIKQLKRERYYNFTHENLDKIRLLAFKISLDLYEDYISLKGTKTLCKKCAFKEDKLMGLIQH